MSVEIVLRFSSHEEMVAFCCKVVAKATHAAERERVQRARPLPGLPPATWPPLPPAAVALREWRGENGVTIGEMGEKLGYKPGGRNGKSCPMISHIELGYGRPGKPSRSLIESITGIPFSLWEEGHWEKIARHKSFSPRENAPGPRSRRNRREWRGPSRAQEPTETHLKGLQGYRLRLSGLKWREVAEVMKWKNEAVACNNARRCALRWDVPWPPVSEGLARIVELEAEKGTE